MTIEPLEDPIRQDEVRAGENDHAPTRAAARAAPMAEASVPSVDKTMRTRSACCGLQAPGHSTRMASRSRSPAVGDRPAEHDHFRIEDRRQVADRHADVLRGIADDRDRHAVTARGRRWKMSSAVIFVQVAAFARSADDGFIARLDAPDEAPDDAGGRDLGFETAERR